MRDFANCTPDFTWNTRLWVEAQLRAADPPPIIAALDHGEIPACSVGNEPPVEHDAELHCAAASAELIDAELVYSARQNNDYLFDVLGTDFTFALAVDALSTEPAPSTRFVLSYASGDFVLRAVPGRQIVVAAMSSLMNVDTLARFASWLGLPMTIEQLCSYEPETSWDNPEQFVNQVTFGTQPPTVIREGSRSGISIDGSRYDALVSKGHKSTTILITPQH